MRSRRGAPVDGCPADAVRARIVELQAPHVDQVARLRVPAEVCQQHVRMTRALGVDLRIIGQRQERVQRAMRDAAARAPFGRDVEEHVRGGAPQVFAPPPQQHRGQ